MIQIFLFFISFCIFKDFIAMELQKVEHLKSEFILSDHLPSIKFNEISYVNNTNKGKVEKTLSMNEQSRKALNDYVQKNPHFLYARVKAMGIEVLSSETEKQLKDNELNLTHLRNEVSELKKTLDVEKLKHDRLEQEKNRLNARIKDIEELRNKTLTQSLQLKSQYELQQTETNQRLERLIERETNYQTLLNDSQEKIKNFQNLINQKDVELDELRENNDNLKREKEDLKEKIKETDQSLERLIERETNYQTLLDDSEKKNKKVSKFDQSKGCRTYSTNKEL